MSQCDRILELLQDGHPHEMRDIHRAIGFCRLNSRVAELRKRGHVITCEKGHGLYVYTLHEAAPSEPERFGDEYRSLVAPSVGTDGAPSGSLDADEQLTLVAA